jgi:hypothetical protein
MTMTPLADIGKYILFPPFSVTDSIAFKDIPQITTMNHEIESFNDYEGYRCPIVSVDPDGAAAPLLVRKPSGSQQKSFAVDEHTISSISSLHPNTAWATILSPKQAIQTPPHSEKNPRRDGESSDSFSGEDTAAIAFLKSRKVQISRTSENDVSGSSVLKANPNIAAPADLSKRSQLNNPGMFI